MNVVRRIVAFYIDILVYGFVIIMVAVPSLMLIFHLFVGGIIRNVFMDIFYIVFFVFFLLKIYCIKMQVLAKKFFI